jgi:hypothetical protein
MSRLHKGSTRGKKRRKWIPLNVDLSSELNSRGLVRTYDRAVFALKTAIKEQEITPWHNKVISSA